MDWVRRLGNRAHIAPEADFLAGTRFKSGGGGIRTLDPPNDG
jgi:hypothetical protein